MMMLSSGTKAQSQIQNDEPNVSIECLDALEKLLRKNPEERITIFDFLQHPWIVKYQRWKETKKYGRHLDNDSLSLSSAAFDDQEDGQPEVQQEDVVFTNGADDEGEGPLLVDEPLFGSPHFRMDRAHAPGGTNA